MIEREGRSLFNIGEAARMAGVSEKALRYYDEHGIVTPTWRDPSSGYRYYDLETVYLMETRGFASNLGLPVKSYDDILIDKQDVAVGDYTRVLANMGAIADAKREQIERLVKELETISRIEREVMVAATHAPNGPVFPMHFSPRNCVLDFDVDYPTREEAEGVFYRLYHHLAPWLSRRVGRIWTPEQVRASSLEACGYLIGLKTGDGAHLPDGTPSSVRLCTVEEGEYPCFIVVDVYNGTSWEEVRRWLESEENASEETLLIAHELGYYNTYAQFRSIVHLVRAVPLRAIGPYGS